MTERLRRLILAHFLTRIADVRRPAGQIDDWVQEFKGHDDVPMTFKDTFSDPDAFKWALQQGLEDGYYEDGSHTVWEVKDGKATVVKDHYADFVYPQGEWRVTKMTHPSTLLLNQIPFYHGTERGVMSPKDLSLDHWGSTFSGGMGNFIKGIYFTSNPRDAETYGLKGHVLKARLNIKNPIDYKTAKRLIYRDGKDEDYIRSLGHDAILWQNPRGDYEEAIVLDPSIIQEWS